MYRKAMSISPVDDIMRHNTKSRASP